MGKPFLVPIKKIIDSNDAVAEISGIARNIPPLAALDMPDRNNRHKDVLVHSFQVLGNAMSMEEDGADIILRTAALFHDIGKPATRVFHGHGKVTFDGHESVGAAMIPRILRGQGYSREEVATISMLVRHHMRGYGYTEAPWSDSALRRLITDTGSERDLRRLLTIFRSDVTTSHANRKKRILAGVDTLERDLIKVKESDNRKALRPAINGYEVMEATGLTAGKELGRIMKFLNSDDGVILSRDEAVKFAQQMALGQNEGCC